MYATVIAILITIMVLGPRVPHCAELNELLPRWPVFLSYVLSFIQIGIYWKAPVCELPPSISREVECHGDIQSGPNLS
jgi:hypothetical protein